MFLNRREVGRVHHPPMRQHRQTLLGVHVAQIPQLGLPRQHATSAPSATEPAPDARFPHRPVVAPCDDHVLVPRVRVHCHHFRPFLVRRLPAAAAAAVDVHPGGVQREWMHESGCRITSVCVCLYHMHI